METAKAMETMAESRRLPFAKNFMNFPPYFLSLASGRAVLNAHLSPFFRNKTFVQAAGHWAMFRPPAPPSLTIQDMKGMFSGMLLPLNGICTEQSIYIDEFVKNGMSFVPFAHRLVPQGGIMLAHFLSLSMAPSVAIQWRARVESIADGKIEEDTYDGVRKTGTYWSWYYRGL